MRVPTYNCKIYIYISISISIAVSIYVYYIILSMCDILTWWSFVTAAQDTKSFAPSAGFSSSSWDLASRALPGDRETMERRHRNGMKSVPKNLQKQHFLN